MPAEKQTCPCCETREKLERATSLAGELIATIRVNALRGTFATATFEEIEEFIVPRIEQLKKIQGERHFPDTREMAVREADNLLAKLERTRVVEEPWAGVLIEGTVLRAGDNAEGIPTIEIEVTREALREIPFNLLGRKATTEIEDYRAKETQPAI